MSKTERVIALVIAQGFNAGVNFFFLPYFVRVLSRADYGLYGQVILVADTARILFSMGTAAVLYVSLGRSKDQPSDFKTFFTLSFGQGILGCLTIFLSAGFFARSFHNEALGPLLRLYCPYILFYIPYLCLNALLIFLGRARASLFVVTAGLCLRVTILVTAVQVFHSLSFVFGGLVLLAFLQLLLGLYCLPQGFLKKGRFSSRLVRERLTLGLQVGFTEMMGFAFAYTDKFMVSSFLSVEDFAVYRSGAIELPVIGTLYTSIATIVLPVISKHYAEGNFDRIVELKRRLITLTAALLYPVVCFLIVFSHILVTTYFSKKYAAGAIVFAIMSCGLFFRVNDFEDILLSSSKSRILLLVHTAAFALNVAINYVLVRKLGYVGAAISTLSSYAILLSMLFYISARIIGKSVRDFLDFRGLAIIVSVSLGLPTAFYFAGFGTDRIFYVLSYGAISTVTAYLIFLKLAIIDYRELSPLILKVPGFGAALDRRLAAQFSPRGAL